MALANVASSIAQRNGGRKVLALDWDLEAPGLHRYFRRYPKVSDPDRREAEIDEQPGLIELLTQARDSALALPKDAEREELVRLVFEPLEFEQYAMPIDLPGLSLVKAGRFDPTYSSRINTFDWEGLFRNQPSFFGAFAMSKSPRDPAYHIFIDEYGDQSLKPIIRVVHSRRDSCVHTACSGHSRLDTPHKESHEKSAAPRPALQIP